MTTVPTVIARIASEVPSIGFLTTKTISLEPRAGYREPILHEYHPGCFVNAVGLANPGAQAFVAAMEPLLPLAGGKPLIVSIMGKDPEEFIECARVLDPIADAFELNLSCPHVKGAGQSIGSDPGAVKAIIDGLKRRFRKPIVPKLSPNLGDIAAMAALCEQHGADALTLINTVGPGDAVDCYGYPVLSNVSGGLSGSGIFPVGLRAVKLAGNAVNIPIVACGGIASARDVKAYAAAGAALFGVGSALAGMTTPEIATFFNRLLADLSAGEPIEPDPPVSRRLNLTAYHRTTVESKRTLGSDITELVLEWGPECEPGQFFFLRLPGIGEKPFSPRRAEKPAYLVREVGPFTQALCRLQPEDEIFMRGPYGKGFPAPRTDARLVLVGGGTGAAPIMTAAKKWQDSIVRAFFGFSQHISEEFREMLSVCSKHSAICIDTVGSPGEAVKALESDVRDNSNIYETASIYICGPMAMTNAAIKAVQTVVPRERIFTAREDIMRCGIGICGSCGTPGGLRSCVDGPVIRPE